MERYEEIERSIIKTYRKCIWRKFVKGINAYKMINEGDKIAVCLSGRASSALLAKCAQEIHRHGVVKFQLEFITADAGLSGDGARLMNIPLTTFKSDGSLADSLYEKARLLGCNKIALGHNFDDVIESILYNMLYGAKISTLMPKERSARFDGMELIRPLYMVKEKDITAWARYNELEFAPESAERDEMKSLIKKFRQTSPYIDKNIFNSVHDVNLTTVIAYQGKDREYNFLDDYDERGQKNA